VTISEKTEYLRSTPIFSSLDDGELAELAPLVIERRLKKDTAIFHEHDPAAAFYLVKHGRVKIFKPSREGREQILAILGEGQIFGDVPVFDGGPYPASAATMDDSEIYLIRSDDFRALLLRHPDIALKVIKVLGQRLRQAMELVRDLSFKQAPHRLAGLLLKLAREQHKSLEDGVKVNLSMSRQEIAEVVGTSRETVTRELKKMEHAGLIGIERRIVTIIDKKRLKNWAR
jgi:CRP/FNR family cyclic AMP-dependent transcriptional regulator